MLGRGRGGVAPIVQVVRNRQVRSVFQPIVDLSTKKIFAHESLARSLSPHFSSPPEMFTAAIESGVCGELGRTLRMLSVDGCTDFPLFINIHPYEFDEGWLVRPDDPIFWHERQVYLEITESVPLNRFELCKNVLAELRVKGIRLAVDDLGAGFSNLKYISDLAPDFVKLDRELIAGIHKEVRQQQLVKSIVYLCEQLGAAVIAEGIEEPEELRVVIDTGVQYGQGYLLARPAFPPPESVWPEGVAPR
jgi:EAL domain-containing protein (putative c-di-GMP-specific phosphodiesterase class I)